MAFLALRSIVRNQNLVNAGVKTLSVRLSHGGHDKSFVPVNPPGPNDHLPFKPYTLDDLPVPQGDYYEDYRKRNRKYWRHLIQGVIFLAGTIYFMATSGIVFFNAFPPELPPKEERIKSFWIEPDDDDD